MKEQIPEHHYQAVLKYMERTGLQDFESCLKILRQCNFQLQNSIQAHQNISNNHQSTNRNFLNDSLSEARNDQMIQFSQSDVEKLKERLFKPKQIKKNSSSIKLSLQKQFQGCFKCFKYVKRSIKKKISFFQKEKIYYFNQIYVKYNDAIQFIEPYELESLQDAVKECTIIQNRKPFAMILSPNRSSFILEKFLENKQVAQALGKQFNVVGLTIAEMRDLKLHRKKVLREVNRHPAIVIYNANQFDEFQSIQKWAGQEIQKITKKDILQARNKCTKINQRKKIFRSSIGRQNQNQLMESYFQSNLLTQDEDSYEDYQHFEQTVTPIQQHKSIINEQTTLYKEMEKQQNIRKKSIELEKQKIEEMLTQRQARKLSLSDYLADDAIAIEFKFRCPDGKSITKKFSKNQKLEILYHFVETHDEIQFQNQPERIFQLYTSYPPKGLQQFKEKELSQIFDQPIENIMIRQL